MKISFPSFRDQIVIVTYVKLQDSDTAKAFGSKPYNRIIKEVADFRARNAGGEEKNVLLEDGGFHQKGKGDLEEQKALHKALALSSVSESAELVMYNIQDRLFQNKSQGLLTLDEDSSFAG